MVRNDYYYYCRFYGRVCVCVEPFGKCVFCPSKCLRFRRAGSGAHRRHPSLPNDSNKYEKYRAGAFLQPYLRVVPAPRPPPRLVGIRINEFHIGTNSIE